MTFAITFELPELTIPYLNPVLEAQTVVDVMWLRSRERLPAGPYDLYPAVFYFEDPHHNWRCPEGSIPGDSTCSTERFTPIPNVIARRYADCKCLSAWRAAELRVRYGLPARAIAVPASIPGLIHVVVDCGDGTREDPSERMGMALFFAAKKANRLKEFFRERLSLAESLSPKNA